jgi:4-hydroxy-3-methylbut-2-enyl diphosphate reductase
MSADLTHLRVILARPRGFCAGVVRAIEIVEQALRHFGPPVYVRHQIVHNTHVVDRLRAQGAVFVDDISEIPPGAVTVFSAHGVAPVVERDAASRSLDVIDATCPLVRKVHNEGRRYADAGYDVVLIGHEGHPEVTGTRGQIGEARLHIVATVADVGRLSIADPGRVSFVTQTTLSLFDTQDVIAALKQKFPGIVGQDTRDICYATQNRQNAVLQLIGKVQLLLVIGSASSSNSNRLREIGESHGIESHLIDSPAMLQERWLDGVESVGVTAGASAPEVLVDKTITHLATWRDLQVEDLEGRQESVRFRLPDRLVAMAEAVA